MQCWSLGSVFHQKDFSLGKKMTVELYLPNNFDHPHNMEANPVGHSFREWPKGVLFSWDTLWCIVNVLSPDNESFSIEGWCALFDQWLLLYWTWPVSYDSKLFFVDRYALPQYSYHVASYSSVHCPGITSIHNGVWQQRNDDQYCWG